MMRRASNLSILFLFLKSQAFVLQKSGKHNFESTSRFFSTTIAPEKVFSDEILLNDEPDSILELTAFLLYRNGEKFGSLSEENVDQFFPLLLHWGKMENGATTVEKLLERLEKEVEAGNQFVSLNNKYYTIAVDSWGKSGDSDSVQNAEKIFQKMEKMSRSNPSLAPTRVTYNALMNAHAKHGDTERIVELLETMENSPSLQPITNDYNVLLWAFAKLGEARQAENVLKRMIDRCKQDEKDCECQPDLYSYNMLLDAWSKSKEKGRGKRAEAILQRLTESDFDWEPDARTYSAAICAIVRSGESDVLERAERVLAKAESEEIDSDVYLQTVLLDAYASNDSPDSARKAEALLEKLENEGVANAVSYNTVIKAWKSSNDPEGLHRAEKIVERMKMHGLVDTISYSTLIAAYANKGDRLSAERAEELLYDMHDVGLIPNVQTLNAVMNAWIRCGAIERAEKILERMENSFYEGEEDVMPSVVTYTTLMNGWSKSENPLSLEKTAKVFQRMKSMYKAGNIEARPNLVSFVTLINGIVKSGRTGAAEKAESIVREMYEDYRKGRTDVKPNTQLITAVIDCWQKSGERDSGERAEALLNWLIEIYQKEGDESLRPNEFSFTATISAWAKTRKFGKSARARAILNKMIQMHKSGVISAKPNTHSYTAVINSCAFCENDALEKRDALQIAVKTYKELVDSPNYGSPNTVTFSTFITALRNLMPPSEKRAAAIETIFRKCAEDGQVAELVLKRLESTLNEDQLRNLVGSHAVSNGKVDITKLPSEWKENAKNRI